MIHRRRIRHPTRCILSFLTFYFFSFFFFTENTMFLEGIQTLISRPLLLCLFPNTIVRANVLSVEDRYPVSHFRKIVKSEERESTQ